jgi:RNA polymerase sigma-70 factor (ECF subfamily)
MPEIADVVSSASTLPNRTGARGLAGAEGARHGAGTIAPIPRRRDLHLSLTELPDDELVLLAQEGEEDAFGEFVTRHAETVHRWMVRAVGEQEADDMTQEVFLRAYRGLSRFRREAPPRAWLASIADNAVKNRYRARSRFRRIFAGSADAPESPELAEPAKGPEEDAQSGQMRSFISEALKRIPAEFRIPVVLRDLEEWSYEEIATSLGVPVGTVKSRISRGRGQLKGLLAPLLQLGKT